MAKAASAPHGGLLDNFGQNRKGESCSQKFINHFFEAETKEREYK